MTYILGLDTWAGSLNIDEQVIWDGGVRFIIPRLNSITGGLTLDTEFSRQWAQAVRFYRVPYFVYSPFRPWAENLQFLGDNLPAGVRRVCVDVEVKRDGYSSGAYAADFEHFYLGAKQNWNVTIYTALWFAPYLAYWPPGAEYWWARYPLSWYPATSQIISWEAIQAKAAVQTWAPNCTLGTCALWQISGDRYKPPGCQGRAVDINLFNGSDAALAQWAGAEQVQDNWYWDVTLGLRELGKTVRDPMSV